MIKVSNCCNAKPEYNKAGANETYGKPGDHYYCSYCKNICEYVQMKPHQMADHLINLFGSIVDTKHSEAAESLGRNSVIQFTKTMIEELGCIDSEDLFLNDSETSSNISKRIAYWNKILNNTETDNVTDKVYLITSQKNHLNTEKIKAKQCTILFAKTMISDILYIDSTDSSYGSWDNADKHLYKRIWSWHQVINHINIRL